MLYKASLVAQNKKDPWLARALFAAIITHEQGFLAVADPASPYIKALQQASYPLERNGMPLAVDATGKEVTIKALIIKRENREVDGMIIAHGDKTNGYALFISQGKMIMAVNQKGVAYQAATTETLPDKMEVTAELLKTGQIRISINDAIAATGKAPGLFTAPLTAPVRTGEESLEQYKVAVYPDRFRGDLRNITLSLNKSGSEGTAAPVSSIVIDLKVVKDIMQYDKKRITVKAGQNVTIRLENPDGMQHNLLIIKPGTLPVVGAAADAMVRDPKASQMQYVPKVPQVLYSTRLLNPGETVSLKFTAPKIPGDYPFVCTFPGHWRGMNGIMVVTK
jgi:azurin